MLTRSYQLKDGYWLQIHTIKSIFELKLKLKSPYENSNNPLVLVMY